MDNMTLKEVGLSNDFMFGKVMSDPEICRLVLQKILGFNIKKVELINTQRTIDNWIDSKGVRLDVYAADEDKIFNIEMQVQNNSIPLRARYYQGMVDLDALQKGDEYDLLKPTYIIFICLFDIFGRGLYKYSFQNYSDQMADLKLQDGAYKVFLNTRGSKDYEIDQDVKEFLRYVEYTNDDTVSSCEGELVKALHDRVVWIRNDERSEVEFMIYSAKKRDIEKDAARKTKADIAFRMLGKKEDINYISEITGLSVEEIQKLADTNSKGA